MLMPQACCLLLQLITAVTAYMVDSRLLAWYALLCWGE